MLQFMRKHAKFFYVFFFLIIISFIFFYVGPIDKQGIVPIAEIGNDRIMPDEYWRTYDRVRDTYREQYKEKFNEEMEKKLKLREKVLDAMIDEKILLVAAEKMGIRVSDEELREAIMNDQAFMKDNVFSEEVYYRRLHLNRLTVEQFEGSMRKMLAANKAKRLISESVELTADDMKQIKGDEQTVRILMNLALLAKKEKAIKSYVEGMKKLIKIRINFEQIAFS